MADMDAEAARPALTAAMDAARAVLREQGLEIERGVLGLVLEGGQRIGASYPEGHWLEASDLAGELAGAFSVNAALRAMREPLDPDPEFRG